MIPHAMLIRKYFYGVIWVKKYYLFLNFNLKKILMAF